MRKLSTKCVSKCLNADPKRQRCQSSEQILEFFRRDTNDFLSRLVIMDDTWLYHYNPETKQQSMGWRHSGSPRPKKFRMQKSAGKVLALSCFYTMPRLTGHLQPRRNWPTWASSFLITHPILRIWPRQTTTCSLD